MNGNLRQRLLFASLIGGIIPLQANAGTTSLDLNVKSVIEVGTCTAEIYDGATKTNTISLGNVPISQVINSAGNGGKSFFVRFSDCAGLPQGMANLKISRRASGCAGGNSDLPSFANSTASASGGASATAIELWTGTTAGAGTQFDCNAPDTTAQDIDVSAAKSGSVVDYPLSARLSKPTGKADSDVKAGEFLSQTIFTISYK